MNYLYTKNTGNILISSAGGLPFGESDQVGILSSEVEIPTGELHKWRIQGGELAQLTDKQVEAELQSRQVSSARIERRKVVDARTFQALAAKEDITIGELQRAIQILGRQIFPSNS